MQAVTAILYWFGETYEYISPPASDSTEGPRENAPYSLL